MTNNEARNAVADCDRVLVYIKDKTFEGTAIDFSEVTGYALVQWDTGSSYWVHPWQIEYPLDREFTLL